MGRAPSFHTIDHHGDGSLETDSFGQAGRIWWCILLNVHILS
ncbi:hypothetical protein [Mycobacterium sp. RTGN5]|nr:hypothetical protein [Mycobacterium sp. RTGN5]